MEIISERLRARDGSNVVGGDARARGWKGVVRAPMTLDALDLDQLMFSTFTVEPFGETGVGEASGARVDDGVVEPAELAEGGDEDVTERVDGAGDWIALGDV